MIQAPKEKPLVGLPSSPVNVLEKRLGRPLSPHMRVVMEKAFNIGLSQSGVEIVLAIEEISRLIPDVCTILEIGVWKGASAHIWSETFPKAHVIGVDIAPMVRPEDRNRRITILKGNSHSAVIKNRVVRLLKNGKVDLLFIDGDHSYNGAKKDLEMYWPLVRKGGIVAMHDILLRRNSDPMDPLKRVTEQVWMLWQELKKTHRTKEISGSEGIGLIYKD